MSITAVLLISLYGLIGYFLFSIGFEANNEKDVFFEEEQTIFILFMFLFFWLPLIIFAIAKEFEED